MKFLTVLALGLFALSSFAADDLAGMKKKKTDSIDKQMSALKKYRSCVTSASSSEIVQSCRYEGPEGMMQEEEVIQVEPMKDDATKMKDDAKKKSGY